MPPSQIFPVENTQNDRDQVAKVLITAMFPDAYYRAIFPTSTLPELIHYAYLRLGANLQNPSCWFLKSVVTSPSSSPSGHDPETHPGQHKIQEPQQQQEHAEEIISYARYNLPARLIRRLEEQYPRRPLTDEEKARYKRESQLGTNGEGDPRGINSDLIEVVELAMAEARKAFPTDKEVITLDHLATLPSYQGTGQASQLVRWGTDLADREGLVMVLEATDGKERFYSRFGFRKVSEARYDLSKWGGKGLYTHVFMVREPETIDVE